VLPCAAKDIEDLGLFSQIKFVFPPPFSQMDGATVMVRRILFLDGADGLHYFPDGPLSTLSTRPLRFLMSAANGTVLMAGSDFASVSLQSQVMRPSGNGPDAN
jgi:hypothetical protein